MQENKKKMIAMVITLVALLVIIVGATYAYFVAQIDNGKSTDVNITAESVDSLTFTTGGAISFSVTQDNFKEGEGNKRGSTTATANLIAGKDSNASYNYYVYLDITSNGLKYTTTEKKPELILKVTDPESNLVTSIDGLTYNTTLGGFDITEASGTIKIAENYNIATTSNKTQTWNIEIEFINLDTNQASNESKSFKAEVMIQSNKIASSLADVCKNGDNLANCIKSFADSNTYEMTKIIKHDGSNENDAGDNNYRYSGGDGSSKLDTTIFGSIAAMGKTFYYYLDDFEQSYIDQMLTILKKNEEGKTLTTEEEALLNDFYTNVNDGIYVTFTTIEGAMADAVKKGLVESQIRNYVCFGSDAETCPNDDLYRIIGVFEDQVKLIKADYATTDQLGTDGDYKELYEIYGTYKGHVEASKLGGYYYNYKNDTTINNGYGSNNWETSLLNKTNLNTNYINYLNTQNSKWINIISDTKWNIGSHSTEMSIAKAFYEAEKVKQTSETAKIGLMYVSDYGYATLPSNWSTNLIDYNATKDNNWMYVGQGEWTITPNSSDSIYVFYVDSGFVTYENAWGGETVRPVMYLKDDVTYLSGDGTRSNPYRIAQ